MERPISGPFHSKNHGPRSSAIGRRVYSKLIDRRCLEPDRLISLRLAEQDKSWGRGHTMFDRLDTKVLANTIVQSTRRDASAVIP